MKLLEVIQRSTDFLAKKGVDSPRLQVELLLAHVLQLPRLKLYLDFEREIAGLDLARIRDLVQRRALREPLQHILGSASFCGLEIKVSRDVLVPRPETELLAEAGWLFLRTLGHPPRALDIGTGSGCIAIALVFNCPSASILAVDVSEAALTMARENAALNNVASRVQFGVSDLFEDIPKTSRFDLLISNPPYIPGPEIAALEPEVREFDPREALDGGVDGLDFYRRLSCEGPDFLAPGGRMMLEFGDGQEDALENLFTAQKWIVEVVKPDYSGSPRILIARREQ